MAEQTALQRAIAADVDAPPIDGMRFLGWLCQWGPRNGPNTKYHGSWASNHITRRGFAVVDGKWQTCPDCRPVYVPDECSPTAATEASE